MSEEESEEVVIMPRRRSLRFHRNLVTKNDLVYYRYNSNIIEHPNKQMFIRWSSNSCWFDGMMEALFCFFLRHSSTFLQTQGTENGVYFNLLNFLIKRRHAKSPEELTTLQISYIDYFGSLIGRKKGESWYGDWFLTLINKTESMLLWQKFFITGKSSCSKCKETENKFSNQNSIAIMVENSGGAEVNIEKESVEKYFYCMKCGTLILNQPLAPLFILDLNLLECTAASLPTFLTIVSCHYRLAYVLVAKDSVGDHFYSYIVNDKSVLFYDDLSGGKTIEKNVWPAKFAFPYFAFYERVPLQGFTFYLMQLILTFFRRG
jgi:hypothetical protein